MSREILFKAKRVDNGEWVEGSLIVFDADSGYYFITEPYISASTLPVRSLIYDNTHLVKPETICQYTGLTDENGKKIWENDILDDYDVYSLVRFDEEYARFVLDDYGFKGCFMEYGFDECAGGYGLIDTNGFDDFIDITRGTEVIGNIFDNPELLEGGTDHD